MIALPLRYPWIWALSICILAAVLEGLLSGTQVKQRFSQLRLPRPGLPLWAWSIIGIAYYLLFFALLTWLLGSFPTPGWSPVALGLVALLLAANATWNWVFFRKRDLGLSLALFVPYVLAALALGLVLFRLHSPLFAWYLFYILYLSYATWWGHGVWRLNRS